MHFFKKSVWPESNNFYRIFLCGCKVDRWKLLLGQKNEPKSESLCQKMDFCDDFRVSQKVSQLSQKASEYGTYVGIVRIEKDADK